MTSCFRAFCIGVFVTVSIAVVPLAGATEFDSPTIAKGNTGHGKQTIAITAGASGAPNGFTLWWMDAPMYNSLGGEWPTVPVPGMGYAAFIGEPTLNTFGGQYTTFLLGPNETTLIEIGDLRQESGVSGVEGELLYDRRYYFVAFANDSRGRPASPASVTLVARTTQSTNCTYTQGFWKNHKNVWPTASVDLGGVTYNKEQLCDIFDTSVKGNGLVSLAHQLIAAKLNFANGASSPAAESAMNDADALIGALLVPPIGGGYLHPSLVSTLAQTLDDFNNGIIGPGHCGSVPTQEKSWGELKSLFR